jgi:peptidoglycan/LPS O-acetylase OafA/YrhL
MYLIIATPLALSLAWLSYRFVELPFLKQPRKNHPAKISN